MVLIKTILICIMQICSVKNFVAFISFVAYISFREANTVTGRMNKIGITAEKIEDEKTLNGKCLNGKWSRGAE